MNNKLHLFIGHAILPAIFVTALISFFIHIKPFILWVVIVELIFALLVAIITAIWYVLSHLGTEAVEKIHIWVHKDYTKRVDFTFYNIPALVVFGLCLAIIQSVYIIGCWIGLIIVLFILGILYLKKRAFQKRVCRSGTSKVLRSIDDPKKKAFR